MSLFGNIIPWFKRGPALSRQTVALEQLMKEEFIGILKKADPILADVFTMHDYGYEADEIREMLHMEKSTYYYQWKRIRDRWKEYNAD